MSERTEYSGIDLPSERSSIQPDNHLTTAVEDVFHVSEFVEVKAEIAFQTSTLVDVTEKVDAVFQEIELPDAFKPAQPTTAEPLLNGEFHHDAESVINAQVNAAFVEAGLNRAFQQTEHHREEEAPQTSVVTPFVYFNGEGKLGQAVDEGNRLAGFATTPGQRNPDRRDTSEETPHSNTGGTVLYNNGEGRLATRLDRQREIKIPQQRRPDVSMPSSLRVSGVFGPKRPMRRSR
jgi:hypothetical protein